jgi:hypothetical protein
MVLSLRGVSFRLPASLRHTRHSAARSKLSFFPGAIILRFSRRQLSRIRSAAEQDSNKLHNRMSADPQQLLSTISSVDLQGVISFTQSKLVFLTYEEVAGGLFGVLFFPVQA